MRRIDKKLSNKVISALRSPLNAHLRQVNSAFSGFARLRLRGEQNKICFAEPKQPKAFEEGLSLEIPLVIQLLK